MSIAGGEPLIYPQIVRVVEMVRAMGWKPIINTNGLALDETLLRDLKHAGAFGFTFHIDTTQSRPDTSATTEEGLNEVRLRYARMVAKVGGLSCSFNATISEQNLSGVPAIADWAREHADIVGTMVFILYRSPRFGYGLEFRATGGEVDLHGTYSETSWGGSHPLSAADLMLKIREVDPQYEPCAYLNGTSNPDVLKWVLASRIVLAGRTIGYTSPRFMELLQVASHLRRGTYLAYVSPRDCARGKLAALIGGTLDKQMRRALAALSKQFLASPVRSLSHRAYIQTLMVIQPVDFMPDGRQDMCDSCPDVTVHDGRLVWSCRMGELDSFGSFVQSVDARAARSEMPQ